MSPALDGQLQLSEVQSWGSGNSTSIFLRAELADSFTRRYGISRLVYFECFDEPVNAIRREKQLKKWNRPWKVRLIETDNPNWDDLYPGIASQ